MYASLGLTVKHIPLKQFLNQLLNHFIVLYAAVIRQKLNSKVTYIRVFYNWPWNNFFLNKNN